MTISKQIDVVKTTFAAFDDKTVALAALENGRVVGTWMDESDLLLMELSLRKELFGRIESRVDSFYELLGTDII